MGLTVESGITFSSGITVGQAPVPARPAHYVTAVGNAQVETSQVKFGTGAYTSNSLAGYLSVTPYSDLAFKTGDFTIELWYYPTSTVGDVTVIGLRPLSGNGPYPVLTVTNGGGFAYYVSSLFRISTGVNTVVTNSWQALAVVRYAGSTKLYVNGTQVGTTWVDTTNYSAGSCIIGANDFWQTGVYNIKGDLDEIRISNIARYTGNYTPATQPFTNDANTLLLLHCDGTNGSKVFPDDNA